MLKLNIQLFGGRGASSISTPKGNKYNSQLAGEILEMKSNRMDYATAVNYYSGYYDVPLKEAQKEVKEYWNRKTGKVGNRTFFIYDEIPKGFKQESETTKYIVYVDKNNNRVLKKK